MINFYGNKKYDEEILKIRKKYNHSKKYLKKAGEKAIIKLKEELDTETTLFDKYIEEKGFHFQFNNNYYKEKYDIEIEVFNKSINSSDSSIESDDEKNGNKTSSLLINDFLNMDNDDKNHLEKRNSKDKKNKIDFKHEEKNWHISNRNIKKHKNCEEKNSQKFKTFDNEGNLDNNVNLLNKLVEIKERYNKLINEKYELDYKKKKMEKKIKKIKTKIINIKDDQKLST